MRATDGAMRLKLRDGELGSPLQLIVIASVVLVLVAAVFLIVRRVAGAFASPLPPTQLVATAVIVIAWALAVREIISGAPTSLSLLIVAILVFAIACSYPGTRVIDWLVWPAAMFAIVLLPPIGQHSTKTMPDEVSTLALHALVEDESDSEIVLQQLKRTRSADGQQAIRGTLLGEFSPGERQLTLYVAFCPPFEQLPEVEAAVADELEAVVKLTQVLHNGAQFELRLQEPAEDALAVAVEFSATAD
jgi:hypothetical protein